jgi:phosphatidylinositol alpha-mannosyltransferase
MKIAVVCPSDLSKLGGVQNVVFGTTKGLLKLGHTVKIISIKPVKKVGGIDVSYFGSGLPIKMDGTFAEMSFEDPEESRHFKKYLNKERFDLVCVHAPHIPMLCWEALYYSTSVNIGWFHTTMDEEVEATFNLVERGLSAWLKSKMKGYIAVSPSVYKEWNYIFNDDKGIIIPNGVDIKRFRTAGKLNLGPQFNILFVGRLDERKGVFEAIKMMPIVLKEIPSKLWIVGDGEQRSEAESLVETLGIQKYVTFVGRVNDEDLPRYYRSADVYCAPSLGGESFGIVLIEAMAAETPVIAYANVGYKYPMEGNPWKGSLVRVGSYKGLAKSILEIANSNHLRKKVVEWQNKKVEEYDWDKIVGRFLEYVERIVR